VTRQGSGYPSIGDLGLVGDGQSVALLGPDGHVEFFCPLRFDAPPLIWPLLDRQRGGHLHIAPVEDVTTTMTYLPDTAVLRYDYAGTFGRARSIAMRWPVEPGTQELLWLAEGLEGQLTFEVKARPEPDFGRQGTQLSLDQKMITYTGDHPTIQLATGIPARDMNGSAIGSAVLHAGQRWGFRLRVAETAETPTYVADAAAGVARDLGADRPGVAGLDGRHHLRRPGARAGRAQRDHAQAAHVRGDRRGHGGGHDVAA
jgi:hypothetical protein